MQSDTLLLAEIFKNFRNKYIEIFELDPATFCQHLGFVSTRIQLNNLKTHTNCVVRTLTNFV